MPRKKNSNDEYLKILVPVVGTILAALIGYYGVRTATYAPISASQTAEAQSTTFALTARANQTLPVSMTAPLPAPTSTPELTATVSLLSVTQQPVLTFRRPQPDELGGLPAIFVDYADIKTPDWRTYEVTVQAGRSYLWNYRWCARQQDTLEKNLENMVFKFLLNEVEVSQSNFLSHPEIATNDWRCQEWETIVEDWQPSQSLTFSVLFTITRPLNDGENNFQAGDYRHDLKVSVR